MKHSHSPFAALGRNRNESSNHGTGYRPPVSLGVPRNDLAIPDALLTA